jgi:hypothetical protein
VYAVVPGNTSVSAAPAERGSGDNQPFEQRHGSFDSMGTGASKYEPNAWFPGERLCYEGGSAARERGQQLTDARTVDPAQSSECKLGITRGVMKPVLCWFAGIVAAVIQPLRYFSRPTHPASSDVAAEKRADGVVEDAVVKPTTVRSFTSPVTAGVIVDPDVNLAAHIVLDGQEIQRTRPGKDVV